VRLDLDGTLVDANYQHAFAWYCAFSRPEIACRCGGCTATSAFELRTRLDETPLGRS